jgi:RNA polymerase sigma-70 factor (ECF subfamily)
MALIFEPMNSPVMFPVRRQASVSELSVPEPSDQELVLRAQAGDAWAEEALFRRHIGRAAQIATRLVGRTSEAEDVVQDSFVIALEQLPKLREGGAFRAWLLRIIVHQAHRRYRKRRMLARLGIVSHDDLDTLASQGRSDLTPEARIELAKLDVVLQQLASRERFAWILRYVEGCRLDEVAHACECSLATAKRRIAAADRRVRRHVQLAEPRE